MIVATVAHGCLSFLSGVQVARAPGRSPVAGAPCLARCMCPTSFEAADSRENRERGTPQPHLGNPVTARLGNPVRAPRATRGRSLSVSARWVMDERETQRAGYLLTIPDTLLQSEAMQRACATRNFREIFRLVNRRTGSSHADMAAAIGKMTSSRVSDIIRGVRGVRGEQVIVRIADGFGIPGEMLGLPRRPWEGSPYGIDGTANTGATVEAVTDSGAKACSQYVRENRGSLDLLAVAELNGLGCFGKDRPRHPSRILRSSRRGST